MMYSLSLKVKKIFSILIGGNSCGKYFFINTILNQFKYEIMRTNLLFLFFLFASVNSRAQTWQKTSGGIKTVIDKVAIEIEFYNPSTVRIIKSPEGNSFIKKSLSVIKAPGKTNLNIRQRSDVLSLKSDSVLIKLNLKSGTISYYTRSGLPLLNEQENSTSFKPFNDAGSNTYTVGQAYVLDKDEAIYGLGQQQQGKMVQRNLTLI